MNSKLRISGTGNVVVPAFLTLRQRGYCVRWEKAADGAQTWFAESAKTELIADDVLTLLALASIAETRGDQWRATDAEIENFLADYETPAV
jgi:hypothetical protein